MKEAAKNHPALVLFIGLFLVSFIVPYNKAFSQGAYLKMGAGYQISSNPTNAMSMVSNTISGITTTTYTTENIGLGKGINFGGGLGYFFNSNIGAEIGINYLVGGKNEYTEERTNLNMSNFFSKSNSEIYTRMLFVNPSIVLKIPFTQVSPYARLGLVMGFGHLLGETEIKTNSGNTSSIEYTKSKTSGGMAWGANAAFGVDYPLTSQFGLFGEVCINTINYRPKKTETIEARLNGNDVLNTISTRGKIIEYEDKYTEVDSNNPDNPNEPSKFGRINMPLSNLSFQLGIRISI
jgi:opacity protein-like surface antigen